MHEQRDSKPSATNAPQRNTLGSPDDRGTRLADVITPNGELAASIPISTGSEGFNGLIAELPGRLPPRPTHPLGPSSGSGNNTISRIVERFPEIANGKVVTFPKATMFVADFVKSTQLVRELEARGISPIQHFNKILNKICAPINRYDGYIIGYHGDNVHSVFLGDGAINRASKTALCILQLWKHEDSPLTPKLRIGLARGNVEAGLLGATQDKRLEVIGSAVNEAFCAARGDVGIEHGSGEARIFFGPSLCNSQRHKAA